MMILLCLFAAAAARNGAPCPSNATLWNISNNSTEICREKCKTTAAAASKCDEGLCVLIDAANYLDSTKPTPPVSNKTSLKDRFCKTGEPKWCAIPKDDNAKATWGCPEKQHCTKTDGKTACDKKSDVAKAGECKCMPNTGLSAGAIAGIVIGSIVLAAGLGVGGYFLYKHLTKNKAGSKKSKAKKHKV